MRLACDIETNGLLDRVDTVWCICAIDVDNGREYRFRPSEIPQALELLTQADTVIFHNGIGYDLPVLNKLHGFTHPNSLDTLVLSRVAYSDMHLHDESLGKRHLNKMENLWGSHSLKAWGIRLGIRKGTFAESTDWLKYSDDMLEYCMQDVRVTVEVFKHIEALQLDERCVRIEHGFAELCQELMAKGMPFDVPAAKKLAMEWKKEITQLSQKLADAFPAEVEEMKLPEYYECELPEGLYRWEGKKKLEDTLKRKYPQYTRKQIREKIKAGPNRKRIIPFNPRSGLQIVQRLTEKYDWKPTEFTEAGTPKTTGEVLNKLDYPEAKLLGRYKDLVKLHDMIEGGDGSWINSVRPDGRLYGSINSNGAVSGRCTHARPNLAQIPAHSEDGKKCRKLFTASPGRVLVGWDASGLELRCLSHYMHRFDGGAYGRECSMGDIHTKNQEAAGLPTRDNAKTFIYGFIYGAGDEKVGQIVKGSRADGARLKNAFLRAIPAIGQLQASIAATVKANGKLKGLDGRPLPIRKKHAAMNTLLQSAGAVLMKLAGLIQIDLLKAKGIIHGTDYDIIATVHDEYVIDCDPEHAEAVLQAGVESLKLAGERLGFRCPLDAEGQTGGSWYDIH